MCSPRRASGVAALLAFALRRAPARTRYTIWLFASLKFLVPLSLFTAAGTYLGAWTPPLATPRVSVVMRWLDRIVPAPGVSTNRRSPAVTLLPGDVDRLALLTFAALWAAGVVSLTIWRWRAVARTRRVGSGLAALRTGPGGRSPEPGDAYRWLAPSASSSFAAMPAIEPGVLGVFQPKLFWPTGSRIDCRTHELESLLSHEVGHVSRRDNLTALIQVVVETCSGFIRPSGGLGRVSSASGNAPVTRRSCKWGRTIAATRRAFSRSVASAFDRPRHLSRAWRGPT